jgi:hypothetical protein
VTDIAGRMADASVSTLPFVVVFCMVVVFQLRGSDALASEMAVLFWTTRNTKGWL